MPGFRRLRQTSEPAEPGPLELGEYLVDGSCLVTLQREMESQQFGLREQIGRRRLSKSHVRAALEY